jgi:microcystin-dependent protein
MEALLGQISAFPYMFEPSYWALCDGRLMQISANQALYSLIGTTFGGDGRTTFALPDLRTAAVGWGGVRYFICTYGLYPDFN